MDPRLWDLHQLLAAYESVLRQGAEDDKAWQRTRSKLYAEPKEARRSRVADAVPGQPAAPAQGGMTMDSVTALLSAAAAEDARYGTS